jgi:hypothetical protein
LTSYAEVREHGEEIYARVADGTVPCDSAWPTEQVALFRRWLDDGAPP